MTLKFHLTPLRMAKIKNTAHVGEKHSSISGGSVDLYSHFADQFLRTFGISLPQDPGISFLDLYRKDAPPYHKDIFTTMFTAALFIIARNWKQPRSPSTVEWIKKTWYIDIMKHYSAAKTMTSKNSLANG